MTVHDCTFGGTSSYWPHSKLYVYFHKHRPRRVESTRCILSYYFSSSSGQKRLHQYKKPSDSLVSRQVQDVTRFAAGHRCCPSLRRIYQMKTTRAWHQSATKHSTSLWANSFSKQRKTIILGTELSIYSMITHTTIYYVANQNLSRTNGTTRFL